MTGGLYFKIICPDCSTSFTHFPPRQHQICSRLCPKCGQRVTLPPGARSKTAATDGGGSQDEA